MAKCYCTVIICWHVESIPLFPLLFRFLFYWSVLKTCLSVAYCTTIYVFSVWSASTFDPPKHVSLTKCTYFCFSHSFHFWFHCLPFAWAGTGHWSSNWHYSKDKKKKMPPAEYQTSNRKAAPCCHRSTQKKYFARAPQQWPAVQWCHPVRGGLKSHQLWEQALPHWSSCGMFYVLSSDLHVAAHIHSWICQKPELEHVGVLPGLHFSLCGRQITQSHISGLNDAAHVPHVQPHPWRVSLKTSTTYRSC